MNIEVIRLAPLLIGFVLSACASSPGQMRSSVPDYVSTSTHPPKTVAVCIADTWEKTRVLGGDLHVSVRETAQGFSVSQLLSGNLHYLADIEQRAGVSVTKLYVRKVFTIGTDPSIGAISSCNN